MKVKLKENVVHSGETGAGRHLKKNHVHDLPDPVAKSLISRKLAIEHEEEEPAPASPGKAKLFKQYAKASKEQLLEVKANAEAVLAQEPGRPDAQAVIEVVTELLKKQS